MKRLLLFVCVLFTACAGAPPQTPYPGARGRPPRDDFNSIYPLPTAGSSFQSTLKTYLSGEPAGERTEYGFQNFVVSGCLGATAAGLTHTPSSCIAYNANIRGTETGSITYSNSSVTWVAMDENTAGSNAGLVHFSRVSGTHYLIDNFDVGQPSMAADSQLLMKVTTAGGAITAVQDLRQVGAKFNGTANTGPINTLPAQTADYSANSHKVTTLAQATTLGDALGWGQAALVTNLTVTGTVSLPSITANTNNQINPMAAPYNAFCDGTHDDTTALQNASIAAFTGGKQLLIPGKCRVTQLNWTNYLAGQIQVTGLGPSISKILCREAAFNTGVCVDMTDTESAVLNKLSIGSAGAGSSGTCASTSTCAPRIVVLASDTVFAPGLNSQIYNLDGVNIENTGGGASSSGDYGLYDYGAEIFQASHYYFEGGAVAAAMFTVGNVAGITSPFRGALATPPTSMTAVSLTQGIVDSNGAGAWGIILEAPAGDLLGDFKVDSTYVNNPGPGFIEGLGTGLIHDLTIRDVRYEPSGGSSVVFGKFAPQVENVDITNDIYANTVSPIVSILQFNKASVISVAGGHISLRPSDVQSNYGTASIVSCATGAAGVLFDSVDASGGGPLNLSACKGIALNYHGNVYDPFLYNGSGASAIPACSSLYAGTDKWVTDGATNCPYNSPAYAAGAGAAGCKVGCPPGGSSWLYGY